MISAIVLTDNYRKEEDCPSLSLPSVDSPVAQFIGADYMAPLSGVNIKDAPKMRLMLLRSAREARRGEVEVANLCCRRELEDDALVRVPHADLSRTTRWVGISRCGSMPRLLCPPMGRASKRLSPSGSQSAPAPASR